MTKTFTLEITYDEHLTHWEANDTELAAVLALRAHKAIEQRTEGSIPRVSVKLLSLSPDPVCP